MSHFCPFSIKAESGIVGADGQPTVGAAPCLEHACMAFTQITGPGGRIIGQDCRLMMTPTLLGPLASDINALHGLVRAVLEKNGVIEPLKNPNNH